MTARARIAELDVEGRVQAEVFVIWLNGDRLELTGPCGSDPWMLEVAAGEHPSDVVDRIVRDTVGAPRVIHSTSWRRAREAVILTFVAVVDPDLVGHMDTTPVRRARLARSKATTAPDRIDPTQVVEHGLRHLAWLAREDPEISKALDDGWRTALEPYEPEPFRSLG